MILIMSHCIRCQQKNQPINQIAVKNASKILLKYTKAIKVILTKKTYKGRAVRIRQFIHEIWDETFQKITSLANKYELPRRGETSIGKTKPFFPIQVTLPYPHLSTLSSCYEP